MTGDLAEQIHRVASSPRLLVACDFDGTLSEIVPVPEEAAPVPGAVEALEELAELPDTDVALVSGRIRDDLRLRSKAPAGVALVGSHGTELGGRGKEHPALDSVLRSVLAVVERYRPVRVERKPATLTVHTRGMDEGAAARLTTELRRLGAKLGHRVEVGKKVVELHLTEVTKGTVLEEMRDVTGADTVVYLGDDTTDEEAFAVLRPGDLGVKVGPGATLAPHQVGGPAEAVEVLRALLGARRRALGTG